MSNVFFIGDLHFGHNNIHKFRPELEVNSEEEHRELLIENWNNTVQKRDVVWVLGDACFKLEMISELDRLKGQKFICLGNHDICGIHLRHHFRKICGITKYKGFWLSHAPIHESELRGKPNIHGHTHRVNINDPMYLNVSCENIGYKPISIEEVREHFKNTT